MRSSKHVSRLTAVEKIVGVKIDFSGEEVTNLGSLQEVVEVTEATQAFIEDNVKLDDDAASQPSVRYLYIDSRL